jgi:hypothetical protein
LAKNEIPHTNHVITKIFLASRHPAYREILVALSLSRATRRQNVLLKEKVQLHALTPGMLVEPVIENGREFSERGRRQLSIVQKRLRVQGFLHVKGVPESLRTVIVDPLYANHPARRFRVVGVNAGQRGGRKFTSSSLFGCRPLSESYYVEDWEKFSKFMSTKLEVMFRAANPQPPRPLKATFTRFMHDFGFHWTGCPHPRADFQNECFGL